MLRFPNSPTRFARIGKNTANWEPAIVLIGTYRFSGQEPRKRNCPTIKRGRFCSFTETRNSQHDMSRWKSCAPALNLWLREKKPEKRLTSRRNKRARIFRL